MSSLLYTGRGGGAAGWRLGWRRLLRVEGHGSMCPEIPGRQIPDRRNNECRVRRCGRNGSAPHWSIGDSSGVPRADSAGSEGVRQT
ncbi:MAG TPA: hypothetical protein VII33_15265 [Nakamurella sp.]